MRFDELKPGDMFIYRRFSGEVYRVEMVISVKLRTLEGLVGFTELTWWDVYANFRDPDDSLFTVNVETPNSVIKVECTIIRDGEEI